MRSVVQKAISSMRDRYFEPITINGLASEVFVSPFHFSRVFSRATGVAPGRYLTAIRLFEAKRLLLTSALTVSDIVCSVGYSSVGTFTSRFTAAVGMTPTQYREPEVRDLLLAVSSDFQEFPAIDLLPATSGAGARGTTPVTGTINVPPAAAPAAVLVGVFAEPIPQCGPVAYTVLPNVGSSRFAIPAVPAGRWTVIAVARPAGSGAARMSVARQQITVTPGRAAAVQLKLREVDPTDPPIAITLASSSMLGAGGFPPPTSLPSVA